MTIEEKAKVYSGLNQTLESNNLLDNSTRYMANCGFRDGAKWMLEKAVNFIRQYDSKMIVCNTEDDNDSFITQFRKAMEE